jgi:hypothetical protein
LGRGVADEREDAMLERLLLMLAFTLPAVALGQTATPVARPEVKVGDSWTYSRLDRVTNQVTGAFLNTVEKIDAGEIAVRSQPEGGGGNPQVSLYTLDWNVRKAGNRTFNPMMLHFVFPLEQGRTWEGKFKSPSRDGSGTVDWEADGRVLGFESVTVPAGTFNAAKISVKYRWVYSGPRGGLWTGDGTRTIWYAPEARRWVKMEEDWLSPGNAPERTTWELKSMKLN